ncbi:MAG: PIG-L family deacetylase [Flavobacteriales bacterium]|nr:PIG-L family deacetylase [Flavobacteriales bacterium]
MHFGPRGARLSRLALLALTLHLPYCTLRTSAQRPPAQPNAAEILHKMQKLNVLGSVLYIVAHPDDENTRLITWLANGKKVRTGNLSLTRGDGGQNLIGSELGDALGIIRTQELMEARRIDGGEQFFTRAVDFGFSKNAAESFEKWGKQEVLSDVVRVIRTFRPDVIITRFAPDRSAGHGHHEASAILAEEAFDLAGDPKAFPEQLEQGLEAWQPRRLFFNGSTWWKKDLAEFAKTDADWFTVDVGGYDPLLGVSYTELAGRSRSMHKSQGFGAAETRGESLEYLKFVKGDRPKTKDIFEGIDMTWGRIKGSETLSGLIEQMSQEFSFTDPARSLALITRIDKAAWNLWAGKEHFTVDQKSYQPHKERDILALMRQVAGLTSEATSSVPSVVTDDRVEVGLALVNRSNAELRLTSLVEGGKGGISASMMKDSLLTNHRVNQIKRGLRTGPVYDEPFWLWGRASGYQEGNLYHPADIKTSIYPRQHAELATSYGARLDDARFWEDIEVTYKWVDRVAGERIRPVYVTPVASVIPKVNNLIARGGTQNITVEVEALTDSLFGQLNITLPEGWGTTKDIKRVDIVKRNERQTFTFQLMPGTNATSGAARFEFVGAKGKADRTLHEIDYPHIMPQVYYTPAEVKLVPLDVKTTAKRVGYIKGAGDEVPQALEQLGVQVDMLDPAMITAESLKPYDAIVTGIRAYNTVKSLKQAQPILMKYAEDGGTLVVQYNTSPRFGLSGVEDFVIDPATLGPYPMKITRDRVTVEEAPATFLDPKHPLLNTPNTITATDFDGWVQERGLYFLGELDSHYTPLIAWNDPGEQPLNGGLVSCDYGKGRYVYTGISFFRELPAGVPGAYRLFANLISKRVDR